MSLFVLGSLGALMPLVITTLVGDGCCKSTQNIVPAHLLAASSALQRTEAGIQLQTIVRFFVTSLVIV